MVTMNAPFYRAQAALCRRLSQSMPQEHIVRELVQLAAEYEMKAEQVESEGEPQSAEAERAPLATTI